MDNVQKQNNCINLPSSQNFGYYLSTFVQIYSGITIQQFMYGVCVFTDVSRMICVYNLWLRHPVVFTHTGIMLSIGHQLRTVVPCSR
jgi:hypothetical protein